MAAPTTTEAFLDLVAQSGVADRERLDDYLRRQREAQTLPEAPDRLAAALVHEGLLTDFQAGQLLKGRWRGFVVNGKYKLLELLGAGGMGTVYLCEHTGMHRRVALKVLPPHKADDPATVDRFCREARAAAALDHPNIVRAHDLDFDGKQHFLVMEYVDGCSLHYLVKKHGPLDVFRAAQYVGQAALGLEHAHEQGLVHRDIKPANLLVDRGGTVKILDLGLARFFNDAADNLTKLHEEGLVGTVDYLAPEQALDSHVDIRADIYSLGMTFYYLLAGHHPFHDGTSAQKLLWHQTRQPRPVRAVRPEVPGELAAILERMIAKDLRRRYQTPAEVLEALAPWLAAPVPPPSAEEMPRLSPAAAAEPSGPGSHPPASRNLAGFGLSRTGWSGAVAPDSRPPAATPRPAPAALDEAFVELAPPPRARGPRSGTRRSGSGTKAARRPRGAKVGWAVAGLATVAVVVVGVLVWILAQAMAGPRDAGAPDANADREKEARQPGGGPQDAQGVSIQADPRGHRIHTPHYDAVVETDGCLTSLRVGGTEFLWSGGKVSRGSYFFQEKGGGRLAAIGRRPGRGQPHHGPQPDGRDHLRVRSGLADLVPHQRHGRALEVLPGVRSHGPGRQEPGLRRAAQAPADQALGEHLLVRRPLQVNR
jgi:serine/threonine protein kinase